MTTLTTQTQRWPLGTSAEPVERARVTTVVLWIAQIAAAGMVLFSGSLKLAGVAPMVQLFDAIGIGQWFRYLTGTIEVVSAVLLMIPALALFGAAALAITMAGAILTHLFVVGGNPTLPFVLFVTTTAIAWARRNRRV